MHEELWQGIEFKLAEAEFFLGRMGKVLLPPRWQPGYSPAAAAWQPDFYFYLDAFIGAARSIPDIVQKCFGWDPHSKGEWPTPLACDEIDRRKNFQAGFAGSYRTFHRQPLSRVRVGTFHWLGTPSVQTNAKAFCGQDYTGRPGQLIPSAACRQYPAGTDPGIITILSKALPVEPSSQHFTLEIPQNDGTAESSPLFPACKSYLTSAQQLVNESKALCELVHGSLPLTPPLAVPREDRSQATQRGSTN